MIIGLALARGSFRKLLSLIIGAIIGIKLQRHFMNDHTVPGQGRQMRKRYEFYPDFCETMDPVSLARER